MNSTLNLLPISFRKRLLIWARVRQWMVCLAITLMTMSGWAAYEYSRMNTQQDQLTQWNEKAIPLRKVHQLNHTLAIQSELLTEKENAISNIQNADLHLQILGMISQSSRNLSNKIQVINYKLVEKQIVTNSQNKQPAQKMAPQKTRRLDLSGFAVNDSSIAEFVQALDQYGYFDAVELKVVNRVELSSKSVRSYQIECTF